MPNQFNGFCYPTINEAANAEIASTTLSSSNGVTVASSYVLVSGDLVDITYMHKEFNISPQASYVMRRSYPSCVDVGQLTNKSGISVADAVTASWLVIAIWAAAYFFKTFRSGVRGY